MILLYNFWTYPILHIPKVPISSHANLQHLSVLNLAGSQLTNLIYFLFQSTLGICFPEQKWKN